MPPAPVVALKTAAAKPAVRMPSFLASTCSFHRPITATLTATNSKCSPQEELADELDRYLRFEAAPVERKEGEDYQNGELSAEEVLLNLLLWWKVCIPVTTYKFLQF